MRSIVRTVTHTLTNCGGKVSVRPSPPRDRLLAKSACRACERGRTQMNEWQRIRKRKLVLLASAFLVASVIASALVFASLLSGGSDGGSNTPASPLAGKVSYLAPDDPDRLIVSKKTLDKQGIRLVHSFLDLQTSVNSESAAIIIDRASLPSLDPNWIRSQYEDGKLIVGIRINIGEMVTRFGLSVDDVGEFGHYPQSRTFYSFMVKCESGGEGRAQDHLDTHPEAQFRLLVNRMVTHACPTNAG